MNSPLRDRKNLASTIIAGMRVAAQNTSAATARYARGAMRPDLVAGLTVAMIAVPQSMAYAQLAAMPPIYGLYAVIVPTIVGALVGNSAFLVTGASNASSLALAGILAAYVALPNYPEYAFLMAILTGIIRLGMGILRMGVIMRYVSNSVLTGLLAAVGTLIILNQLPTLLGIPRPSSSDTLVILHALFTNLGQANPYVFVTGLFSMVVLLALRWLSRHTKRLLPGPLLAILLAAVLVFLTGWHERGVHIVSDLSSLENAGLRFHIPAISLSEIPVLLPGALALSIFSLIEAINIAKAVGMNAGERLDASREFAGQGVASLVGGFFQCFPSSGSPARTTVNWAAGAKTRMAAAFSGGFVWLSLLIFAPQIGLIPNASLAGVMIVSATGVFNAQHIRTTWNSRDVSRLVMVVTYLAAVFLPLQNAIYVGLGLSIFIYIYQSSKVNIHYLTRDEQGHFIEHPYTTIRCVYPRVLLINLEGPLSFGATEGLEQQLAPIFTQGIQVLVLRMRRVQALASSGIFMLEHLIRQARGFGIQVILCEVNTETLKVIRSSGLTDILGPEHIFPETPALFAATEQALAFAHQLVSEEDPQPRPGENKPLVTARSA